MCIQIEKDGTNTCMNGCDRQKRLNFYLFIFVSFHSYMWAPLGHNFYLFVFFCLRKKKRTTSKMSDVTGPNQHICRNNINAVKTYK